MPMIRFENIVKTFGKKRVLNKLSLDVRDGEIFGLIGRSGCGKTTLLKILFGMLSPDSGKIVFDGKNISFNGDFIRKNTGFATQENMLYDELTLRENILYYGKLYDVKKKVLSERIGDLLSFFELSEESNKPIRTFSGGMKKRANILVSLIHDPKLLVLDEPTVGLDPLLRNNIWHYIREVNKLGKTIIVTSHLLEEIEQNCTSVGVMKSGKILGVIEVKDRDMFNRKSLNKILEEVSANA